MDGTNVKNYIETIVYICTILGGFFAIYKFFLEFREGRRQKEHELKWKMSQMAKELNDEMLSDKYATFARQMIDWPGNREYDLHGNKHVVNGHILINGLRTTNLNFNKTEVFIRDCFDSLFYYMSIFEHYVGQELIKLEDISYPIGYYIRKIDKFPELKKAVSNYLTEYEFENAKKFVKHFSKE